MQPTTAPVALHAVRSGAGPTVVCLHASAGSSAQWQPLAAACERRYRCVAVDLHGHGRSAPYGGARYTLHAEADAVAAQLADEAGPLHLVGHSYGGAVALALAARLGSRVASVAVYEPALFRLLHPASSEYRQIVAVGRAVVERAAAGERSAAACGFIDFWSGSGTWDALTPAQRAKVEARIAAVAAHFEALFDEPLGGGLLAEVTAPVVVVRGDLSPAPALAVCAHVARRPNVTSVVLRGLGHMGPVTHPAAVNRRLISYLDQYQCASARNAYAA